MARKADPSIKIQLEEIDGVLIVSVFEGEEKPYSYAGKFFIREGANAQQLTRNEIQRFFQKEGRILFDETPNKDFDLKKDFDDYKFNAFLEKAGVSKTLDKKLVLENLNLLSGGRLKNAGVLFFSRRTTKFFVNAFVSCCIFKGATKAEILDKKEFDADLYSNYENAILYLQKNLRTRFVISDAGPRKEVLEIPEDVLREAVLNALVHRDYFDKGAGVSIEIYSDRIEVSNPGGLVAGLNPRDFGKKSLSRNPLLFGLVHRRGLVEKAGSGIARMRLAMGNAGLAEPEFEFDSFFTVVLKRPVLETTLKAAPKTTLKTTQKILGFLKENPRATREELAVAFGITVDGVKYHLSGLKKSGLLKRVGGRKSGSWVVVGGIEGDGGVFKLRYYCQGAGNEKSEEILSLLRKISEKHGVNFEVVDLSTNGKYDAARENEVYDEDFKPRAKLLKARTGVPVTRLRSRKARTYFVSIPGTLAVVRNGVVEWFALNDGSVAVFLEKVLNGGVSSIMELLR